MCQLCKTNRVLTRPRRSGLSPSVSRPFADRSSIRRGEERNNREVPGDHVALHAEYEYKAAYLGPDGESVSIFVGNKQCRPAKAS